MVQIFQKKKMSIKKESPSDQKLHRAAMQGDLTTLRKVLDSGKVHVDCMDQEGTTPLILASANNHYECVQELLQQAAFPNHRRVTGTTALFFASQGGFLDIVKLLLKNEATVDATSVDGGTPLVVACQCGHIDVVKELVTAGANIHAEMKDKATPLFIAAQNGHLKVVLFLLSKGARVDCRRMDGATPLWIASQIGHAHVVRHLLLAGANVDAARHDGATPLFKACHKGHVDVAEELLKYKPCLGRLPNGETALHAAALFGHIAIIKLLANAGVNPKIQNQDGYTAMHLAREGKHYEVISFLQKFLTTKTKDLQST